MRRKGSHQTRMSRTSPLANESASSYKGLAMPSQPDHAVSIQMMNLLRRHPELRATDGAMAWEKLVK